MTPEERIVVVEEVRRHIVKEVEAMADFSCGHIEARLCNCSIYREAALEVAEAISMMPLAELYGVTPIVTIQVSGEFVSAEWGKT